MSPVISQPVSVSTPSLFRIDVAWEHLWTSDKDQSAGERSARLGVLALAAECGNQGLGVRRPETDAARKRLPSAGIERDGCRRLRHAIGFKKRYAGALLEPLADSLGQDGAAVNAIRTEATLFLPMGTSANAAMDVGTPLTIVALN